MNITIDNLYSTSVRNLNNKMVWLVRHQDVENSIFYMYKNPSGQENIRGYKVGAGKQKATTIKGTVSFRI